MSIQQRLDKVSPSFCAAKWSQVLFNLQVGQRHNCCLSKLQYMKPAELLKDPNNLFNDEVLFKERQSMLAGEKIPGCNVCWTAEDKGSQSDRHSKSAADWSSKFFEEKNHSITGVTPTYVEVSFGNKCQMMCTYCSLQNSSSLAKEAKKFGNYRFLSDENLMFTQENEIFVDESENHIFGKVFWDWFLLNHQTFEVLRFTGGEPLLSKWMDKFLDWLKHNSMGHADLAFNSNLSLPDSIISKFIQKLKDIPRSHYKNLSFFTSLDGWGSGAELARYGINLNLVEGNIQRLWQEFPEAIFRITATLNVLAFPDIKPLFEKVYEFKQASLFKDQFGITCYALFGPGVLALNWSKDFYQHYYDECLDYLNTHLIGENHPNGFFDYEIENFIKAVNFRSDCDLVSSYADFYLYIAQFKHRKELPDLKMPKELEQVYLKGHEYLLTSRLEDLSFQLWVRAEPWIQSAERQKEVRDYLYGLIISGPNDFRLFLNVHLEYAKYILHPDWIEKWFTHKPALLGAFEMLFVFCLREPDIYRPLMKAKLVEHFATFNNYLGQLAFKYHRDLDLTWEESEIKSMALASKMNFASMNPEQLFFLGKVKEKK